MKTQQLGSSDLVVTRLGYGNMRSAGTWQPGEVTAERRSAGIKAHIAAYEAGYTLFDTADIYCHGVCEEILGETLSQVSGMRGRITIATKCGIRFGGDPAPTSPHRYDFSADHIIRSCEQSLRRLGIETIDLYHLHRPDLLMDPDEVSSAFGQLHRQGKVRWFGVSNFLPWQVSALAAHCAFPLVVNQVEISLSRLDCFNDGTLHQCLERRITPLSWSPLGRGTLAGDSDVKADDPQAKSRHVLAEAIQTVAAAHGASRAAVCLAWLLKHPAGIIPIVGSNNPQHIRDAVAADSLLLTRDQWYQILLAARGQPLP